MSTINEAVEGLKTGFAALDAVAGKLADALAAERAAHASTAQQALDNASLSVAPAVLDAVASDLGNLVISINEAANRYAAILASA